LNFHATRVRVLSLVMVNDDYDSNRIHDEDDDVQKLTLELTHA